MKNILFVSLLFVLGCTDTTASGENRLTFQDGVAREMLVDALKAQKIAYRVDDKGGVWYPAKDERAVDEITKDILRDRFSGPATSFEHPADVSSFRAKLTQAGITYKTKVQHGQEWTTWEKADDLRARLIQESVYNESMERSMAERAQKQESQKTQKLPSSN